MKLIAATLLLLATTVVHAGSPAVPTASSIPATRSYFVRVESKGRPAVNVALNVLPGAPAKARVGTEFSYVRACTAPSPAAPVSLIPGTAFDGLVIEATASPTTDEVTFALTQNTVSEIKTVANSDRCSVQKVDAKLDTRTISGLRLKEGASIEGVAVGNFVLTVHRGQDR